MIRCAFDRRRQRDSLHICRELSRSLRRATDVGLDHDTIAMTLALLRHAARRVYDCREVDDASVTADNLYDHAQRLAASYLADSQTFTDAIFESPPTASPAHAA